MNILNLSKFHRYVNIKYKTTVKIKLSISTSTYKSSYPVNNDFSDEVENAESSEHRSGEKQEQKSSTNSDPEAINDDQPGGRQRGAANAVAAEPTVRRVTVRIGCTGEKGVLYPRTRLGHWRALQHGILDRALRISSCV